MHLIAKAAPINNINNKVANQNPHGYKHCRNDWQNQLNLNLPTPQQLAKILPPKFAAMVCGYTQLQLCLSEHMQ